MIKATEASVEAELRTKGLNAPRLTSADIDATIVDTWYWVVPGTTTTVCALKLRNGYTVVGKSASASPENFDRSLGERIARDDARRALEGYLLREKLSRGN